MSTNPYAAYSTVGTTTADPITLTTMLFDGAIKAIRKAKLHFEAQNREGFLHETNRAYLIVGELLATLDIEQGELPKQLNALYVYCMRLLTEATIGDTAKLDEVAVHISKIGASWKQATASIKAGSGSPLSATEALA